jgi:hypothetical protein
VHSHWGAGASSEVAAMLKEDVPRQQWEAGAHEPESSGCGQGGTGRIEGGPESPHKHTACRYSHTTSS